MSPVSSSTGSYVGKKVEDNGSPPSDEGSIDEVERKKRRKRVHTSSTIDRIHLPQMGRRNHTGRSIAPEEARLVP